MGRTAKALSYILENCKRIRFGNRCNFASYYGLAYDRNALRASIPKYNGPTANGKRRRGCQDCGDCEPQKWRCSTFSIEFLTIEFAADVEFPTRHHHLTQESIILGYLSEKIRMGDFIVFNTGLHDTTTTGKAPAVYAQQL